MGIYIFNRQLMFDYLQNNYLEATDFGKEIIPQSIDKCKVASYQYDGYWTDIGNIYSFFEANLGLTEIFLILICLITTMQFIPVPVCCLRPK